MWCRQNEEDDGEEKSKRFKGAHNPKTVKMNTATTCTISDFLKNNQNLDHDTSALNGMINLRFNNSQIHPVGGVEVLPLTCLLRPDDEQFGEAVTCFLFGPDVLVPFVLTRIL